MKPETSPSLSYEELKKHLPVPNKNEGDANSSYQPTERLLSFYNDINSLEDTTQQVELAGIYDKQAGELWENLIEEVHSRPNNNPNFIPSQFLLAVRDSVQKYNFFSEEVRDRLLGKISEKEKNS